MEGQWKMRLIQAGVQIMQGTSAKKPDIILQDILLRNVNHHSDMILLNIKKYIEDISRERRRYNKKKREAVRNIDVENGREFFEDVRYEIESRYL